MLALLAEPPTLSAQGGVPLGPEFRVNDYTTDMQRSPSVASDSVGNFVVAWQSNNQDGGGYGVFAQRYATGLPLGPEFRINTYTPDMQRNPSVASDSAGNFVVGWQSNNQDGDGYGVFAQRYASTGAPQGGEFRVNTYTTSNQGFPSVASDWAGNFVVVWESVSQDGSGNGIFAQRYSSTGVPQGGEFRVNTYTTSYQGLASAASDSAGNFVVTWHSDTQDGDGFGVFAQRYASTGAPQGGEFRVNTYTTSNQGFPSVASDSAGNFVVAWDSYSQDGSGNSVSAQRYASTGVPLGGEFPVNTYTASHQGVASVASDSAGNFVVAWHSNTQDGNGFGIFAQRYASTGTPLDGEFRVNTFTTGFQGFPSAASASDTTGNFLVAWESDTQDGSGRGVFAQLYSMIVPVELQGFSVE